MITRASYQAAVSKLQRIMLITSLVVVGPMLYGVMRFGDHLSVNLASFGRTVRSRFGEATGGAIGGLLIGSIGGLLLLLWLGVMLAFDRRFGIRCPHCHRSLTARCLPKHVLETGKCSLCHAKIFDAGGVP